MSADQQPSQEAGAIGTAIATIPYGTRFYSRSGRMWKCVSEREDPWGRVTMIPLGSGTHSGGSGGVTTRRVEVERLFKQTHGWERVR